MGEPASAAQNKAQHASSAGAAGNSSSQRDGEEAIEEAAQGASRQHGHDLVLVQSAARSPAQSGAPSFREAPDAGTKRDHDPESRLSARSDAASARSGARAVGSHGVHDRPWRVHQDVQQFLIGIHESAEMEAQLQV